MYVYMYLHTYASETGRWQFKAGVAVTFEAAVHVDADAVRAHSDLRAFVFVGAHGTIGWDIETGRANTLERTSFVGTPAIDAFAFLTFVDIYRNCY